MTTTTAPAKTTVVLRNGFEGVLISIEATRTELPRFELDAEGAPVGVEMIESDTWMVTVVGLYSTSRGDQVGGVKEHSFSDHDEAREYANRWFSRMVAKGYRRTV